MTSEWISPLVVPLALLAFLGWARQAGRDLAAAPLGTADLRGLRHRRMVAVYPPHRPLLDTGVAGDGSAGRGGGLLEFRGLVATRLEGLLLAALAANFLISSAGPGNAWFVPLAQLRNDTNLAYPVSLLLEQ